MVSHRAVEETIMQGGPVLCIQEKHLTPKVSGSIIREFGRATTLPTPMVVGDMRDIDNRRRLSREWYQTHKEVTKARARAWDKKRLESVRKLIDSLKSQTPCADCKGVFPPICMDFDHISDNKVDSVSSMHTRRKLSLEKVMAEIEKCELVCSNCHRIRTLARRLDRQQSHTLSSTEFDSQASDQAVIA